jgi:hypothetical protein
MKIQIFPNAEKYNLQKKILFKRNQNPSRYYYYNSIITNLKFEHKPEISSFKKSSYKKIGLLLLLLLPWF